MHSIEKFSLCFGELTCLRMPPDPEPGAMEHGLSTLQFICLPTVRMYVHIHIHDYTDPA